MSIFKCKMCGGALEIDNNETVVTCDYCGTQQTLPKLDDERRANLYDRANHFRRNNEFDKAMGIYEQILNEDSTDAEAYWSLVLCRYGIEYVEDPRSHKRLPTVNRAQFTSVFEDNNYRAALQYADSYQRAIYEQEAKAINEIQKGILAISQKEEPFDVFVCYKETDNTGRRTPDSVLANDLYHQLTQEGFKVFFARITLEDKLGSAYEPYIFAALNSAKVMVVLGTKPEHFNAVWVKNEWSRYLSLIKNGAKKMLIPAYKDMDPYDLPEEFSHLQAQDMSKLGFMQDLIRGIKKILEADAPKTTTVVKETVVTGGNATVAPLLKRAFMFLEDGEWESADEYCEKVLDIDPECAEAYLGKLMSEMQVHKREDLKKQKVPFDKRGNYVKAVRFGDEKLKAELQSYIDYIVNRNFETAYADAISTMVTAKTEQQYKSAAAKFEKIRNYKDAGERAKECREKAEETRLSILYGDAISAMNAAETEQQYKSAASKFSAIKPFRDAEDKAKLCLEKAEEIRLTTLYNVAVKAMETATSEEDYKDAAYRFKEIAPYKDAEQRAQECLEKADLVHKEDLYSTATLAMQEDTISSLRTAISLLKDIAGWKDSTEKREACERRIREINEQKEIERVELARLAEEKEKADKRKKTVATIIICTILAVIVFLILLFKWFIPESNYKKAAAHMENGEYLAASELFKELGTYKDSADQHVEAIYQQGVVHWTAQEYDDSNAIFQTILDYKDSRSKIHDHTYIFEITKKSTCTAEGIATFTCENCPATYTEPIGLLKHNYAEKITKQPTCTEAGVKTLTCKDCNGTKEETVKATGHTYKEKVTTAAKCETAGVKTFACHCGHSYTETIKAKGHKYDSGKITTKATCDKDGVKTFTCSCGESYTEKIKATGHKYSEATCTADSKCSTCGNVKQKALGHNNVENLCTRCKANLTQTYTIILDGMEGGGLYGTFDDFLPAQGYYRTTVTVLDADESHSILGYHYDAYVDIKNWENFLEIVDEIQVKKGEVFEKEHYISEYASEIHYEVYKCKVQITITPIEK